MISALKDGDRLVQRSAAEALSRIRDPSSVEAFISALDDKNIDVKWAVRNALEIITGKKFKDPDQWQEWRAQNK